MAGQDPTWGIIFQTNRDVPIYHFWGRFDGKKAYTRCGRVTTSSSLSPWLPLKHLKRFARVCRSCSSA